MISGGALLAGLVGRPVRQSLSPLIHNAWAQAAGLDAVYVPFELAEAGFERFIEGLRDTNLRGVNVTMPFKARALACADQADAAARAAEAANLLVFRPDDVLEARNTDGEGLLYALARQAPALQLRGARVVLLGAGGGAQGAASALLGAGASITLANRTPARAEALAGRLGAGVTATAWEALGTALETADLVLNATAAGFGGGPALDLPWDRLPPAAAAMDMVYHPLETPFLAEARRRGLAIVDGLEMLIGQARPSFEAFYGVAPPELDVRALALRALEGRG